MALEFHQNKLFDIWVFLDGKNFDWIACKLSLFTSAFKKTFDGTHMFADWLEFASAFSIFLENEISYITRGNKQLNFLEVSFTGFLAPTQQSKRKRNFTFSDNAKWAQLTSGPNAERWPVYRQKCAGDFLGFPWPCDVPVAVRVVVAWSPY